MDRRTFLSSASIAAAAGAAGCLGGLDTGGPAAPPVVEDRPSAVYYPSHVEGMQMAGMGTAGPYELGLTYSFPHRFWLTTGENRERVDVEKQDTVHLMATVWDAETGTVVPASSVSVDVVAGGESVANRRLWPMLSQNMGVHYGDNVALDGDGRYEATVTVDPVSARLTGAFVDRFGEPVATAVQFEFSQAELEEVTYRRLDEKKGTRGAVSPMEMQRLPVSRLPAASALPGTAVGEATSGDGVFVATALAEPPAGVEGEGAYLAVSARTPYNRYPLPMMTLSATLDRGGETVFDDALSATLDPELGYHYGAVVGAVEAGDELALSVGVPPQIARHEGYETAFFEMDAMRLSV